MVSILPSSGLSFGSVSGLVRIITALWLGPGLATKNLGPVDGWNHGLVIFHLVISHGSWYGQLGICGTHVIEDRIRAHIGG
jgi:hypothetical protein